MRLANEIAAAAMEHVQGVLRPGMTEAQAAAEWLGFVHGEGTGWKGQVELALGFSLVWSGPGIKTFTATTSRPVVEGEPTLFEIWVCADGYWADHTKNLCPASCAAVREAARAADGRLRRRGRLRPAGREPRGARPARPGRHRGGRVPRPALAPDLPRRRRPRARAAVRPPGGRRRDPRGHGAGDRAGHLLAGGRRPAPRGQLPDHRGRDAEKLSPFPDGIVCAADRSLIWTGPINDAARIGGSRRPLRHDAARRRADRRRRPRPAAEARARPGDRRPRRRADRGRLPARLARTTGTRSS